MLIESCSHCQRINILSLKVDCHRYYNRENWGKLADKNKFIYVCAVNEPAGVPCPICSPADFATPKTIIIIGDNL